MSRHVPRSEAAGVNLLDVLWEDGERVLYRAFHQEPDGDRRSLLVACAATDNATSVSFNRLEHEYGLKERLDAAWAIQPLELVVERGRTLLVLDDPGGEVLHRVLGSPMELARFLRLAEALAAALRGLHGVGFVHKDVNPANVLVHESTGQVKFTGFGVASLLPSERQTAPAPRLSVGTLPYMAPEQTGRMNRSVDCRSDLYSLGVIFYQMLTGSLPFVASDPMEWVHCHIAINPLPPHERLASVPVPVSRIIMKLLAKTAEDRYQTAAGLEHDLRRCRAEWDGQGYIEEISLAERDVPDRLLIPERLYGRTREVATLLRSFQRVVATGMPELVLVRGYSGIGKSSVVNEIQKALVPTRGLFASGKFDQYLRDIPYATLGQAFRSLVRQILAKSEAELRAWRAALSEALGSNGLLIVDLVPDLELVVGKQPPVPDLPTHDAQRRFRMVLRRFIAAFARSEHPLALFLDDLQWVDPATLDLFEDLMTQQDVGHLLLIGAYRDNEVDAAHPLVRKFEAIRRTGTTVQDIVLSPLGYADLGRMIADSLHCNSKRARPLVQLVQEKTGGNPFFAIQFLHTLADEALLSFDHGAARWSWDLDRIHAKRFSDNVVDLMVAKLNRLPAATQLALRQLACVGASAKFALLGMVCESSQEDLHASLWEGVRSGLVLRSKDSYAFQHDRIQEAAYSLIPQATHAQAHLRIGRLLLAHTLPDEREEIIFEIVSHFARSTALLGSRDERDQVAELHLIAGKRAKKAAAYSSALTYFAGGRALLAEDCWTRKYSLTFDLDFQKAECEFLAGEAARAQEQLAELSNRATTPASRSAVTCMRVDFYTVLAQSDRAVAVCLEYLRHVGFEQLQHPTDEDVRQEYERLWKRLGSRPVEHLINLPLINDTDMPAILDVVNRLMVAAMYTNQKLHRLMAARMANLSLEYGNSNAACCGYIWLGTVLASHFGNYAAAFRFGQLGLDLVDERGLDAFKARVYLIFGAAISPWVQHVRSGRAFMLRASAEANRTGELPYVGYCRYHLLTNSIAAGDPLADVEREALSCLDFTRKTSSDFIIAGTVSHLYLVRMLKSEPLDFKSFNDVPFEQGEFVRRLETDSNLLIPMCLFWIRTLQARVFAEDYGAALAAEAKAHPLLWMIAPFLEHAEYHLYAALARAGCADTVDTARPDQKAAHLEALASHHLQLRIWAEHCPENFQSRAALVGGELARLEGRDLDAQRSFQLAVRSARTNGFVHIEALACEAAARFYAMRGFEDIAEMYLTNARNGYLRWGAGGKVRQLEARHPQLAMSNPRAGLSAPPPVEQLDVAAVVKASQALSSEMLLPRLIEQLMTIALQNAGADRGLLILPHQDGFRVEAEARIDSGKVVLRYGVSAGAAVPEAVVRFVLRTQQSVILEDAPRQNMFADDPYFRLRKPRSILCLALVRQGALGGLLYLENTLASHVFTADRARLLELLASQAAISLQNTRLYADLQEREARVRRLVDSNIIGILIWGLEGSIKDANEAFLEIVGYDRAALTAGKIHWKDITPLEWHPIDAQRLEELRATGVARTYEKEIFKKDGTRVPVLVGGAIFDATRTEGVAFVLDLTDRKRVEELARESERRYHETQLQLAHANRVATLGHLSASIAHELNQPLSGVVVSADTALLWLTSERPNIAEAQKALARVVRDGKRASEVFGRIRTLIKKAPPHKDSLNINEVILEIVSLTQGEAAKHGVLVQTQLRDNLPVIQGDRVQLQQVTLNLIMNALEAIGSRDTGPRKILISTTKTDSGAVNVRVQDSGPGLDPADLARIFDAFYTTKANGLGMGLSICRSIIESHQGRLSAAVNDHGPGATFSFSIPC